jgi:transcriptional regulator with XRE-family HTH domain
VVGIDVRHLGEYIREQRAASDISLRQLAKLAGVSNPYLSQIERGLRKPSAEILQQIAKALRISAEALYVQAGILEHREGSGQVADAVLTDEGLNERQKQVLLEIYDAFRKENASAPAAKADDVAVSLVTVTTALPEEALSTGPADAAATDVEPDGPASTAGAAPAPAGGAAARPTARAAGTAARAAGSAARKAGAARKPIVPRGGTAGAGTDGPAGSTPSTA